MVLASEIGGGSRVPGAAPTLRTERNTVERPSTRRRPGEAPPPIEAQAPQELLSLKSDALTEQLASNCSAGFLPRSCQGAAVVLLVRVD